jgi:predicted  nucleic acid-binding Zn-ribbon protein
MGVGVQSQAERLIVLQDLLELRREMADAEEASKLAAMGFTLGDPDAVLADIDAAVESVRTGITPVLLRRFERIAAKYRRPVAPVRNGTCYGCFTRIPTGKIDPVAPDGVVACPNCGRLVYPI